MSMTGIDVVIITALEEEREAMRAMLPDCRQLPPTTDDIRVYYRCDLPVTLAGGQSTTYGIILTSLATMGRVPATATTADAIHQWHPRYVVLVGIAGGVSARNVKLGDVLIADQVVDYEQQKVTADGPQYRFRLPPVDQRLLEASRNLPDADWRSFVTTRRPVRGRAKRLVGPVATGDKVVAYEPLLAQLRASWPQLIGVEMEAGGVAVAASQAASHVGFFMVRGVCDLADDQKGSPAVERWREYACHVAAAYTVALLRSGPLPPSDGGRTFASGERFFQRMLDPARLYNHAWTLVGREDILGELHTFVGSKQYRAIILPGRGGVGKTKILHALSGGFEARHPGVTLRFLRDGVPMSPESQDELPAGPCVLVVDDAHRREDIGALCAMARDSPYPVKLLLATRPHAVGYLRSVLAHTGFDAREIERLSDVSGLDRGGAKSLARQALGDEHDYLINRLVAATRDCPLVTVVGGRLLAQRHLLPAELEQDDEFRMAVLDRFRDILVGDVSDHIDVALCQSLLPLLAAIAPFRPDDERLLAAVAEHLGTDRPTLVVGLGALEEAGILLRHGYALRLVPDVLADHILHRACVTPHGQTTGFAQVVYNRFSPICPEVVLVNLAELDWRISRAAGRAPDLLDSLWRSIVAEFRAASHAGRCLILGRLTWVAPYQPERLLSLVETALRHPASPDPEADMPWGPELEYTHDTMLRRLPAVLRGIGYTLKFLPRCCDLLWQLGQDDGRPTGPTPEHAMRVLKDLARYDLDTPLRVNEIVLEATERWVLAPDAHRHAHSPLDVLDPLLAKVSVSHHTEGHMIITRPFLVHRENTCPLRERAMCIVEDCAGSTDLAVMVRAFKSVEVALANPLPFYGQTISREDIESWVPEQLATLDMVARLAITATHPLVYLRVEAVLAWHARHRVEVIRQRARAIIASIPDSFEVRLARAFVPDYNSWMREETDDVVAAHERGRQRREEEVDRVVQEFLDQFPMPEQGAAAIDERLRWDAFIHPRTGPHSAPLLVALARLRPEYVVGLCEAILADPNRPLAAHLPTFLSCLRAINPMHAPVVARRAVESGEVKLAASVAQFYHYIDQLLPADVHIVEQLLYHTESVVKEHAIGAIRVVSRGEPRRAVSLARGVDIGANAELAEVLCEVFDSQYGIPHSVLGQDGTVAILVKIERVRSIDGYHVGQFLVEACACWPRHVAVMLLRRITRAVDDGPGYEAFPSEGVHGGLAPLAESIEYAAILRDIRDAALGRTPQIGEPLSRLFGQASQGYDEQGMRILDEWIDTADAERLLAISILLQEAPRSLLFSRDDIVARFLQRADAVGEHCYVSVFSVLEGVAIGGSKSRGPGQPFPEDVDLRLKASEAAARWVDSQPAYRFYRRLTEIAEDYIEATRLEDEAIDND